MNNMSKSTIITKSSLSTILNFVLPPILSLVSFSYVVVKTLKPEIIYSIDIKSKKILRNIFKGSFGYSGLTESKH